MGDLLAYSGVSTKLRAMQSRLFTREQCLELAASKNVTEAVNYLRQHPAYHDAFARYEGEDLHREKIESILDQTVSIDFQKIYRFCGAKQRRFLDMYFQKYEVKVLKRCLSMIFDHRDVSIDLSYLRTFQSAFQNGPGTAGGVQKRGYASGRRGGYALCILHCQGERPAGQQHVGLRRGTELRIIS